MDRWYGKVAVVTGASSGIGAAVSKMLVRSGINVVGLARRLDRLEDLSIELAPHTAKLYPIKCDLTDEEEILAAFQWVKENLGTVNIMINNAGITQPNTLIDGDTQQWRNIFDVNVIGLCICTREAIRSMQEGEVDGQIIHINSVVGHYVPHMPLPILNVYPASKFAVTALTEMLRQELNHNNLKIKITSISPGFVETEFQENLPSEEIRTAVRQMPNLRSDDIATAVKYVLSTPPSVQITELTIRPLAESF